MKKMKRMLAIVLVLTLLLPSFAQATGEQLDGRKLVDVTEQKLEDLKSGKLDLSQLAETLPLDQHPKEEEKLVRLIVETDIAPGSSLAKPTDEGLSKAVLNQSLIVDSKNDSVLSAMKRGGLEFELLNTFNTTFSGFSIQAPAGLESVIAKLDGVRNVYVSERYILEPVEPNMESSHLQIHNRDVWESFGYKGEGTVVAVLDTGIDAGHKDMVLTNPAKAKLSKPIVEKVLADNPTLVGKFLTDKVPFSYNYFDNSFENKDLGVDPSMHGMHVAGTIGANGPTDDALGESITGVAPETQLLNMKVFGNDAFYTTTYTDIYIKAIDDAIKLGADAVNLSLGSPAGTNFQDDVLNRTVTNAVSMGADFAMSAGNESYSIAAYTGHTPLGVPWPFEQDQDYGVVGSPSVSTDSISVASYENIAMLAPTIELLVEGEIKSFPYSTTSPISPVGKTGEMVFLGTGTQDDYDAYLEEHGGGALKGKVVVVMRGQTFTETQARSQKYGGVLHVVYNHENGGEELINMATNAGQLIPSLFVGRQAGLALQQADASSLLITEKKVQTPNPNYGMMSSFSSMGPSPHLQIKPEISAPGGQIYSTLNNDSYGVMSGTSMAAPHVSGALSLIRQYLAEDVRFVGLTLEESSRLAKVLLMNSADILEDPEENIPYAVRHQGAGGINIRKALSTPMTAVDAKSKEAKFELGILSSKEQKLSVKLSNLTDRELTYTSDVVAVKDYIYDLSSFGLPNLNTSLTDFVKLSHEPVEVVLKPGESKVVDLSFDFSADELQDKFIDGWLIFTSDLESQVSLPFMGFVGNWNGLRSLDTFRFAQVQDSQNYFSLDGLPLSGLFTSELSFYSHEKAAISPGTEAGKENNTDSLHPVFTQLRNLKSTEFNILDAQGKLVRQLEKTYNTRKHVFARGYINSLDSAAWDGTARGKQVPDGEYIYEIKLTPHLATHPQVVRTPIFVDTLAPKIEKAALEGDLLKTTITDELTGINQILIVVTPFEGSSSGIPITKLVRVSDAPGIKEGDIYTIDLADLFEDLSDLQRDNALLEIIAFDHAMNLSAAAIKANYDTNQDIPWLYVLSPDLYSFYNAKEQNLSGYVLDKEASTVSYSINGSEHQEVETQFASNLKVIPSDPDTPVAVGWSFDQKITLDEGYNQVEVLAVSDSSEEKQQNVTREVFIDTIKPVIELVEFEDTAERGDKVSVTLKVTDQLEYFEVFAFDDKLLVHDKAETMRVENPEFTETITFQVPVYEEGQYPVEIVVKDIVGNESETLTLIVNPKEEPAEPEVKLPFTDLEEDHWAQEFIKDLVSRGLLNGYPDGSFRPDNKITRAELAKVIVETLGLEKGGKTTSFTDLSKEHWAYEDVAAAAEAGLLKGYTDGSIRPDAELSRAELAVVLIRAYTFEKGSKEVLFTDITEKHWAYEEVMKLASNSIINGYKDNSFRPNDSVSRAEFATMLSRTLSLLGL